MASSLFALGLYSRLFAYAPNETGACECACAGCAWLRGSHDLRWTRPTLLKPDGRQSTISALILKLILLFKLFCVYPVVLSPVIKRWLSLCSGLRRLPLTPWETNVVTRLQQPTHSYLARSRSAMSLSGDHAGNVHAREEGGQCTYTVYISAC